MNPPAAKGRAAALLLWLAGLAVCIFVIARTQFSADLSAFLPSSPTPAQQILVEQLRDGVVARLLLLAVEDPKGDAAAMAASSKKLAAALRADPLFAAVTNGEEEGLTPDREFFWKNRYLLSPGAQMPNHFTAVGIRQALDDDIQLLGSPAGSLIRQILPSDPTGELIRMLDTMEGGARPLNQEGAWFSRDGRRAILMVQTRAAGYDIDAQEVAHAHIRAAFAQAAAGSAQRLVLSGPGVFASTTRASIKDDAWRLSMMATVLVALLMLAVYRSPRVLLLAFLPVASGAVAGIAAVSLIHGAVHGITLGFGVTLIGEGVDYAIYLFTQIAPGSNARAAVKRLWPTLRLGVLTSVCGFSALLFSGFPGLAQLGLFSIVGLIVAAAVTRFVLPVLVPDSFAARGVEHLAPSILRVIDRFTVLRIPFYVVTAAALVYLIAIGGPPWSDNLASLSPVPKSAQQVYEGLSRDLGAPDPRYLVIASAPDAEGALQAAEKLAAPLARLTESGALEGYESPAQVLPSLATQKARQQALPDAATLAAALKQGQEGTPFKAGVFDPFLKDVEAARTQPLLTRASMQGGALALKVDSLLIRRAPQGGKTSAWAAILPLRGVQKPEAIAGALARAGGEVTLLDIKHDADAMFSSYRREAESHTLLGAAAIVALLFASLRAARRVFDVVAPLAAAVLLTTVLLVLGGAQLTIFHLVGLSLVVAVGSNYSLFFEKQSAAAGNRERTIVSLLFANVAMAIAFGLLGSSSVPVLAAIGLTVAIGAVLSLLFSAILARR